MASLSPVIHAAPPLARAAVRIVLPAPLPRLQASDILTHIPALRAFALQLCRNTDQADDLVQDALCRALNHLDRFTPGTRLRSWLFTILRNGFYSGLRKKRREVDDPLGLLVAGLAVGPAHDGAMATAQFLRTFAALSEDHRQVLTLVGAMGLTYDEAAKATRLKAGTVKSRVSRARALLGENPWPLADGPTLHVLCRASVEPKRW